MHMCPDLPDRVSDEDLPEKNFYGSVRFTRAGFEKV
jgi:hypothetical protein